MPRCLLASPDGVCASIDATQADAARALGAAAGDVALVGAVDELRAFAVARRARDGLPRNPLCVDPARFHELPLHGPVLFVGTDDDGEEADVDAAALERLLRASARDAGERGGGEEGGAPPQQQRHRVRGSRRASASLASF